MYTIYDLPPRHHVDFRSGIRRGLRDGLCVG